MRFKGLDLNLLAALDALLAERSVSLAAQRLHMTQPAVSQALARLRAFFGDELLAPSGRSLVLTPRAEAMIAPLRETLAGIQGLIVGTEAFEPAGTARRFSILASDYSLSVAVGRGVAALKAEAPLASFDIAFPTDPAATFDRRRADLVIMPAQYMAQGHPTAELYRDDWVLAVWSGSALASEEIGLDRYFQLGHVAAHFGPEQRLDTAESLTLAAPRNRRVEVTAPSFTAVPLLLEGSDLVATMPRRLADIAARALPLALKPLPFEAARIHETMQWRRDQADDPALLWIVDRLQKAAAA